MQFLHHVGYLLAIAVAFAPYNHEFYLAGYVRQRFYGEDLILALLYSAYHGDVMPGQIVDVAYVLNHGGCYIGGEQRGASLIYHVDFRRVDVV